MAKKQDRRFFNSGLFYVESVCRGLGGLALGHGRRHSLRSFKGHHGDGFMGNGICPQTRTTLQAPDNIQQQTNPLEKNQELFYAGETLFQVDVQPTACKICHGVTGNGFGLMAQGLRPPPRNFTCGETMKTISDGQLFWIIRNGSPGTGMPAYKNLKDREIWQIIHYLRKFPEKKR